MSHTKRLSRRRICCRRKQPRAVFVVAAFPAASQSFFWLTGMQRPLQMIDVSFNLSEANCTQVLPKSPIQTRSLRFPVMVHVPF